MPTVPPAVPYQHGPWVVDDDGDYEYFWDLGGVDIPIPRWLAEIVDVPFIVRLEIFLIGVCAGLILAGVTLLIAFLVALA